MTPKNAASRPKVLFLATEDHLFWGHPLPVAKAALKNGYEVVVATTIINLGQQICDQGFRLIPLKLARRIDSPWNEVRSVYRLWKVYRTERPDIVHHLSLKSILYGSIARLGMSKTGAVNAVTGLGYLATTSSWKGKAVRKLTWSALRVFLNQSRQIVVLENYEDKERLSKEVRVSPGKMLVTRGAGVDVELFQPSPEPAGPPVVMLASRLLQIKGIEEFVNAAEILKARGVSARFVLSGDADANNPSCIPRAQLQAWQSSGVIEWWGHQGDMPAVYRQSTLVCLPSRGGEGIPKVIMEAAASGRAIVTTDVPGCRDVVRHRVNGLLVPPREPSALVAAIEEMLKDSAMRAEMGRRGREIAVSEFSQEAVVNQIMGLYTKLLKPPSSPTHAANAVSGP
jgi:glycosyltransferase involved in cell wall biosynthesis